MAGQRKVPDNKEKRAAMLEKKRNAEKLRQERIKADPALREIQRKKEHEKYLRKLEKGQVKPVCKLTDREHRAKKKKWRCNSKNYYERKRYQNQQNEVPSTSLGACSFSTPTSDSIPQLNHLRSLGMKRRNKNREKLRRELLNMRKTVKNLRRKVSTLQKREQRRLGSDEKFLSPRSKVKKIVMKSSENMNLISKKLLFGEVLMDNLQTSYCQLNIRDKTFIRKLLGNNKAVLKKYKLMNHYNSLSSKLFSSKWRTNSGVDEFKMRKFSQLIREDVRKFFERDDVSKMCPGRKDFVTFRKVRMQKRLLLASEQKLHLKFCETSPYKLGYSTFCKLKPFWVRPPTVSDRETCACKICSNIEFLVSAMYKMNIIDKGDPTELSSYMCCDVNSVACLQRSCTACKNCTIPLLEYEDGPMYYDEWVIEKKEIKLKSGKIKQTNRTVKKKTESTVLQCVNDLEKQMLEYMRHEGIRIHQYREIDALKRRLSHKEVLIHCDFSENYEQKYARETQSCHFGGSKAQYTLHTVQVYYKKDPYSNVCSKSLCTLSECNRHSAPAIWAHLQPIFQYLKENVPEIERVHFLSDAPSTQYRNKTMFYIFSQALPHVFPSVKSATWNYSAAGHGKGAADGIGGRLKRMANDAVAHGADIDCFETFVAILCANVRDIKLFVVTESEITAMENVLPTNIKTFVGTMKTQQVVYLNGSLTMKSLSCLKCIHCSKFSIGTLTFDESTHAEFENDEVINDENLEVTVEESTTDEQPINQLDPSVEDAPTCSRNLSSINDTSLNPNIFVLVKFDAIKKKSLLVSYRYVCRIKSCDKQSIEVQGYQRFKGSHKEFVIRENDVFEIGKNDVIDILPEPEEVTLSRRKLVYVFPTTVDVNEM